MAGSLCADVPNMEGIMSDRPTLVDAFVAWRAAFHIASEPLGFLARLREADVALDEARICAQADAVRIRELVGDLGQEAHAVTVLRADRDREVINREAVQRVLADTAARYAELKEYAAHSITCAQVAKAGARCSCGFAALLEEDK